MERPALVEAEMIMPTVSSSLSSGQLNKYILSWLTHRGRREARVLARGLTKYMCWQYTH